MLKNGEHDGFGAYVAEDEQPDTGGDCKRRNPQTKKAEPLGPALFQSLTFAIYPATSPSAAMNWSILPSVRPAMLIRPDPAI